MPRPRGLSVLSPPSLPRSSVLAFAPLPALSLRAVGNAASLRLSVRSVASFPRSPSARAGCYLLPPLPPCIHAGCLSFGGSSRCRSPRWGVRSLRSVSPRWVAPSAPSLGRGQSLCGHRCAPFGLPRSPRPPSSPLRSVWAGCERPRVVRSLLPCGVFVVRGSLAINTIASPSARLLVYICKV